MFSITQISGFCTLPPVSRVAVSVFQPIVRVLALVGLSAAWADDARPPRVIGRSIATARTRREEATRLNRDIESVLRSLV
jgi:hypothetical protein